jgi:hypothetical protein
MMKDLVALFKEAEGTENVQEDEGTFNSFDEEVNFFFAEKEDEERLRHSELLEAEREANKVLFLSEML